MLDLEAIPNMIEVKYLVVDIVSPNNFNLGRLTLNLLWVIPSNLLLSLKYPFLYGRVTVVIGVM